MRRRVVTAFLALALAIAALLWARPRAQAPVSPPVALPPGAAVAQALTPEAKKASDTSGDPLPPTALAVARACVGGEYSNMDELAAWAREHAGAVAEDKLEWRAVQFRDPGDNRLYRLTLEESSTESGAANYKLKLFSVDKEGLPDPLPVPAGTTADGNGLLALLEGKEVQNEIESRRFRLASGNEWRLETENGRAKEIDFGQGGKRLRCSSAYVSVSCHCSP